MKRTKAFCSLATLAVSIILAVSAAAQQSQKTSDPYKKNSGHIARAYAPRIRGGSSTLIFEGLITRLEDNVIVIKTTRGESHSFEMDDQTSVLGSGELVSIATMADIALSASELHVADRVEIITERVGRREVARIITRIESSGAQVAKR